MMDGNIFLTGGAGFLSRAIMRRAQDEDWPCKFIVYSRDELKQSIAKRKYKAKYVLGDVRDSERLYLSMLGCDTVIHTAALKYVPEAEYNVSECIDVNVQGTRAVMDAAIRAGVSRVVFISTDKAVSPLNVYGMTKALGERLVGEYANYEGTKITAVRYGNVIGSTGSVIPEFIRQYKEQGFVNITDPNMTRFWISADEAIDLILCALGDDVLCGSIIIPKARALDLGILVRAVVPNTKLRIIGLRPGEKMHECLLTTQESRWVIRGEYENYELIALRYRESAKADSNTFEVTSDTVMQFTSDLFMSLVEDAEEI